MQLTRQMSQKANAIGDLSELQNQSMVLQGITFNVPPANADADCDMMEAMFVKRCSLLRRSTDPQQNTSTTYVGFGPEVYAVPPDFRMGVSNFGMYGGHSTLSFRSSDSVTNVTRGNGLKFIKIGAETFRISKAIAYGKQIVMVTTS